MNQKRIYLIHGTDAKTMAYQLLSAANLAAIIGDRKDQLIGIKPNLVVAGAPQDGATTHPEIIEGVVKYLREQGYTNLCALEGSWAGEHTENALRISGIGDVCRKLDLPFFDTQKDTSRKVDLGGMTLSVCEKALSLDFLINLPVVKGHCQTTMTCALKNMKGLIPNSEKRRFHTIGLHEPIAHLNLAFPRQFILADNICGDLDMEGGGNPVQMDRLLGGTDPVLMDAYVCQVMGHDLKDVPYIGIAESLGIGSTDLSDAEIIALNENTAGKNIHPTRRVQALAKHTHPKDACSACYGILIHALARMDEQGMLHNQKEKICIGQGWRGEKGVIGVGRCTKDCEKSLIGCPPKASDIIDFLSKEWK